MSWKTVPTELWIFMNDDADSNRLRLKSGILNDIYGHQRRKLSEGVWLLMMEWNYDSAFEQHISSAQYKIRYENQIKRCLIKMGML